MRLTRARAERRARGEGAGTHAEARAERRGNVAKVVAAAGAVAVVGSGSSDIGAHPLATGFAKRIDALHGETGQVLHGVSLRGRKAQVHSRTGESWSRKETGASLVGQIPRHALTRLRIGQIPIQDPKVVRAAREPSN